LIVVDRDVVCWVGRFVVDIVYIVYIGLRVRYLFVLYLYG